MRRRLTESQEGFAGGLNITADRFALAKNELRRAENARLGDALELRKRRGTRLLQAAALGAAPVRGGFGWVQPSASAILIAACNGQLHTATYGLPTVWTPRAGAIDAAAVPCFAAFRDGTQPVVYVADGGLLNKIDAAGTVTPNIGGTPAVSWLCVYNQRLVAGGDPAAPTQVAASGFGNGDTLGAAAPTGFTGVVETYGEGAVVAGGVAQGTLFLFHPTAISLFTGITIDDIAIGSDTQGLTPDVGCAAPRSVVSLDMGVMFLSDRGFRIATPAGVFPVSTTIDSALRDLDHANWARVWGVHARRRREVRYSLPGVGVYSYAYQPDGSGVWMGPETGTHIDPTTLTHCLWESEDAEGRAIVLRGAADGRVDVLDYRTPSGQVLDRVAADGTGGTAYTLSAQCRALTHGSLGAGKSYKRAIVTADLDGSREAGIAYRAGGSSGNQTLPSDGSSTWGGGTWGGGVWGGAGMVPYTLPVEGSGPFVELTIVDGGDRESAWASVTVEAYHQEARTYA